MRLLEEQIIRFAEGRDFEPGFGLLAILATAAAQPVPPSGMPPACRGYTLGDLGVK
jgi:hypothetical protein